MVQLAMLVALVIVLQIISTLLPVLPGGVAITLTLVPVVIGAQYQMSIATFYNMYRMVTLTNVTKITFGNGAYIASYGSGGTDDSEYVTPCAVYGIKLGN